MSLEARLVETGDVSALVAAPADSSPEDLKSAIEDVGDELEHTIALEGGDNV